MTGHGGGGLFGGSGRCLFIAEGFVWLLASWEGKDGGPGTVGGAGLCPVTSIDLKEGGV